MKKILSFALIFVLSLTVYSTFELKAEATEDVTITFHIHQFDGDYTNTGLGIWDGVDWHGFVDVSTETDEFGAIITKTWSMDKVNNENFMDSMQVKPSSNGDDSANYLAPASVDGQVFIDVTSLKDGSATTLDVYYVEGALDFYVATNDNALFMNVFANTEVAADPDVYEGWGMHVWNNGAAGSHPEWDTPVLYDINMEIQVGDYLVPMRLGVLELSVGATAATGFIAHAGDSKACPDDMTFDGASLIDEVNGNKAQVVLFEKGTCEFAPDYETFQTNVLASYNENLKNKFMSAMILTPEALTATMLTPKSIFDLDVDRFSVTDGEGNVIDISGMNYGQTPAFAPVDSEIMVEFQTYVRVYVKTDYDHSMIGMVGNFNGWDAAGAVTPAGEYMGYAVFEVSTNETNFQYLFLYNDGVDNTETADDDETGFDWADVKFSGEDNLTAELLPGDSYMAVFHDDGDMLIGMDGAMVVDPADYTYTSAAVCAEGENLFTLFVDTDYAIDTLGVVGSIQTPNAWTPSEAITSTILTDTGIKVFEICTAMDSSEYKMLSESGMDNVETTEVDESMVLDWGDNEVFTVAGGSNKVLDWAGETNAAQAILYDTNIIALSGYEPTIEVTNTYRYTLYLNPGELDVADFGVVGAFEENAWDPSNPMVFTMQDSQGNYYIDFEIHTKDFQYKVLYNPMDDDPLTTEVDESALDWAHSIFGNDNSSSDLAELSFKAELISYTTETVEEVETMTWAKDSLMDQMSNMVTLEFADGTLMYGTDYTISYVEAYAMTDEEEDVVIEMGPIEFALTNNFVEGDDIAETGTYALSPTQIAVIFNNGVMDASAVGVELVDGAGNAVAIDSIDMMYGMGAYTPTVTCDALTTKLTVYLQTNDMITDLSTVALVGTPQQSGYDATLNEGAGGYTNGGWNPGAGINPVGIDANGNLVFEICVDTAGPDATAGTEDDVLHQEFKVLFNAEGTFAWGDAELTQQIVFDFDGDKEMFLEEGRAMGESASFVYNLADANKLVITNDYTLKFTEGNGFMIEYPVLLDDVAPELVSNQSADKLEINNDATAFDLDSFFTQLYFLDNQDGNLGYTVESTLDLTMVGEQNVVITATDKWGNKATETLVFTVLDVIAPTITLEAAPTFTVGDTIPNWNDYVTVTGGTLVINDTQVDFANASTFNVIFVATDEAGNTTQESLLVTIEAGDVPDDVIDDVKDEATGCFGSVGVGFSFIAVLSVIGTAAFVVIRKR